MPEFIKDRAQVSKRFQEQDMCLFHLYIHMVYLLLKSQKGNKPQKSLTLGASLGHVWVAKVVLLALTLGSQLILYTFSVTSAWRYIGLHLALVTLAHHGAVAVTHLGSWLEKGRESQG